MSYTYEAPNGTRFFYNPDLSGTVWILDKEGNKLEVNGQDLIEFIARCYVAPHRIRALEEASAQEILGTE